ncbi:MBL fold metallo-hydrolase [Candidatus Micrarchaeota archaeon]|nr:MBL fold metallo-hydrolase [Candidatus Micrarchaeota archaeon]
MKLTFHGAAREVGRAGCLVEHDRRRVMLDYGVKVSPEQNITPLPVQGFLDAVIVTHAHLDHSGAVPTLFHNSEQPVFMTPPSMPLIDLLVKDSLKVNDLKGLLPIFSEQHVKRMMRNVKQVMNGEEEKVAGKMTFSFHDAGHILGAASAELNVGNQKLVYTGDIKFSASRLHNPAYDKFKAVDVLVTESTYGNREHPERTSLEKQFVESCTEICEKDGNVLVPAFAVGRSQEIIEALVSNDFNYSIYMDGMCKSAAEQMMEHPDYLRDYDEFYRAMKQAVWITNDTQRKQALDEPSVIVSTAGMLSGGPALSYLFKMRGKKDQAVFFSGYQPSDTPGYGLLHSKRLKVEGFDLDFSPFDIRYFDFSAHADKNELFAFVKKTAPKLTLIQHGEEAQALAFAKRIEDELGLTTVVPTFGQKIDVDDYV